VGTLSVNSKTISLCISIILELHQVAASLPQDEHIPQDPINVDSLTLFTSVTLFVGRAMGRLDFDFRCDAAKVRICRAKSPKIPVSMVKSCREVMQAKDGILSHKEQNQQLHATVRSLGLDK
jgi:hypothetical protein